MMHVDTTVAVIVGLEFPHFWITPENTVYVALDENCPGYYWALGQWRECAGRKEGCSLVKHAVNRPDWFKSILPSRAISTSLPEGKSFNSEPGSGSLTLGETIMLYNELLYAVARKFTGESRHQTALRYIREREAEARGDGCVGGSM